MHNWKYLFQIQNWFNLCIEDSSPKRELKCAQQHFGSHAVPVNSPLQCWCLHPSQQAALSRSRLEKLEGSKLPPSHASLEAMKIYWEIYSKQYLPISWPGVIRGMEYYINCKPLPSNLNSQLDMTIFVLFG